MKANLTVVLFLLLYPTISLADGKLWYFHKTQGNIADVYIHDLNKPKSAGQIACGFSNSKLHIDNFNGIANGVSMSAIKPNEVLVYYQHNAFGKTIYRCDQSTPQLTKVFDGSYPVYFPKTNSLFFFALNKDINKWGLYSSNNFKDKEFITADVFTSMPVVPISDDEFIYTTSDDHDASMYKYSLSTKKTAALKISNCTFPVLWRSKTQQLLCFDRKQEAYFLTSLNDTNHTYLEFKSGLLKSGFVPVFYSASDDKLFYTRVSPFSEAHDLYIYDFKTHKKTFVLKNSSAGINGLTVTE